MFDRLNPNNLSQRQQDMARRREQERLAADGNRSMAEGRRESRVDYGLDDIAENNLRLESAPRAAPSAPARPQPRPTARPRNESDEMAASLNRAMLSRPGREFVNNEAPGISDASELKRRLGGFPPDVEMAQGGYVKMADGGDVRNRRFMQDRRDNTPTKLGKKIGQAYIDAGRANDERWRSTIKSYFDEVDRTERRALQEEADRRASDDFNENGRSTKNTFRVRGNTVAPTKMSKGGMVKMSRGGDVSTFGKAFREARDSGLKEFEWNGNRYNTRTREEESRSRPESVRPTAKSSLADRAKAASSGSTDDYKDTSKPIDRASALRETDRVSRGVKMAKGGMVSCDKPKKMAKGGLAGTFDMPGMSDTPGRAPQNRRPKMMKSAAKPKVKATMKAKNNMPMPKMAKGGMSKRGK
ncbi:hypothetical protein [Aquidulcibacter sp.]|uniref:hypothetical protein n=1 Tax=Aquidulcibacter sp. TaxID=2052990 RepID=UPI0025C28D41|nr:hypothetical protein [Aquidulcibacter sp.]MCA3693178.1 hypothetical protein [Aquidulcibacter sp.]